MIVLLSSHRCVEVGEFYRFLSMGLSLCLLFTAKTARIEPATSLFIISRPTVDAIIISRPTVDAIVRN